ETSEPKNVVRTRKTKKATFEVADVGEEEAPTDGTVSGTQESEVVASKSKSKPKAEPRPNKDVVSPTVEENKVDAEAGDDGGSQSNKAVEEGMQTVDADIPVVSEELQVRKRRHLRRAISTEVVAARDSEETQSDEDV
ncbi:hypothetical protein Dimus_018323, partial [Dionaea muscipula]